MCHYLRQCELHLFVHKHYLLLQRRTTSQVTTLNLYFAEMCYGGKDRAYIHGNRKIGAVLRY